MSDHVSADKDAKHWPECWCNGTGFRRELGGVPCNLPQLTASEHAYVIASDVSD